MQVNTSVLAVGACALLLEENGPATCRVVIIKVWLAMKGCCNGLSAHICFICLSESCAALALYSMFLLCILRSIRSMFSLYVGGEGRCMTVYVYLHCKDKLDASAVFWINPSLCSKLYWEFLFHKLLHTSAFCLMVNSNSLIVWIQVRYICFTYSCKIKFCHVKILYMLGITVLLYILSSDQFTPPPRPVEKPFRCCIADIFRGKNHF